MSEPRRYDSATRQMYEAGDWNFVLNSDYAALERERDKLAQEVMRLVNINEQLHGRHDALVGAVSWEGECDEFLKSKTYSFFAAWKHLQAARAEVDRLIANADDCEGEG